jgi:hypothetical protein
MSNSKSLLDLLPAPKSSQNLLKPRTVTNPAPAPPNTTNFNKHPKAGLNQQPATKNLEISSNAIISSKPIPAASTSKIQKTGNYFSLNYGNDSDDEEEEKEEVFEEKVINPVKNRQYETNANYTASVDSSVADILRFEGKKRRHDNSIINIVDVNVKDVIEKNKEELLKNLTTDAIKPPARTLGTSKKHHQITYLAAMAKERESELSKQWSDNKFNRKLSKSKYGF